MSNSGLKPNNPPIKKSISPSSCGTTLIKNLYFYSFTSNQITGVLIKDQNINDIKNILDKIKNYNSNIVKFNFNELIFDEELEDEIKEIYGSLDFYTQKY